MVASLAATALLATMWSVELDLSWARNMILEATLSRAVVGRVVELARYPIKSTAGQRLDAVQVNARGLAHDRLWAMYLADGGIVSGKTTRRFRKVDGAMRWRSSMPPGGSSTPVIEAPDGRAYSVADPAAPRELSRAFDRPVRLGIESTTPHHDECGVHLVTTSSIRRVEQLIGRRFDRARLRSNIVVATDGVGFIEDDWSAAELTIGNDVVLAVGPGMPRCIMLDQPQAAVRVDAPILKTIGAEHEGILGVQATVLQPGRLALGDIVSLTHR